MSRNLSINTMERMQKRWTPSPEMAIREEDGDEDGGVTQQSINSRKTRIIEEAEEENKQNEEEEEDEEEETGVEDEEESDYTSSPSIPDENINFDLVYTLHTFEATVDGQASVKKGDALTLLDDSNSYWWLIRDLKTSEVGYIPAENIETPFERLARLNKHRNVELTSIEQASHYINKPVQKSITVNKKKVSLSTSLNIQLHVLLTGENEEDIEEETYEEWDEEMLDDDSEDEMQQEPIETINIKDDDQGKNTPLSFDNNNTGSTSINKNNSMLPDSKNKQQKFPEIGQKQEATSATHARTDPSTSSQKQTSRFEEKVPAVNQKVLRVFAGNVDVGASYHSVRVTESTSVAELLQSTMEKFHITQIETRHGRFPVHNSCVEYYLTVKTRDGDEITLDPQDKPYAIHESLTTHLTTPMPSLTQFRQLASSTNYVSKKKKKRTLSVSSISDGTIQFLMHKRIKRVNDKSGQVHIKVSLMTTPVTTHSGSKVAIAATASTEKLSAIRKMTKLAGFSGKKKTKTELTTVAVSERIDKLIAIPANITIADLTSTALVKFHIISDIDKSHQYRLLLNVNGKDKLLNTSQRLAEVLGSLQDDASSSSSVEKCFILRNFSTNPEERPVSLSSSTSSSSSSSAVVTAAAAARQSSSKVFPEPHYRNNTSNYYYYSPHSHPVMTRLDSNTEAILKRVDAALESYEPNNLILKRKDIPNNNPKFPSPMAVSRNERNGVDIHLPHGLLRSTALTDKKVQYSLMKSPNTLVLQKIMPATTESMSHQQQRGSPTSSAIISGEEMAALAKYGSQYLDTLDTANRMNLLPNTGGLVIKTDKESDKSLSSLDGLEKEFQRIITSHSS